MNNKITFPRLATMLADRSGRSKRFSEDFLREFFALISETLEAQDSVKIKGLGTFRLTRVEPRRSVDVTTGEPMEISGHSKVVFIPSKELAEAVNAPFEAFSAIEIKDDVDITKLFTQEEIDLQNDSEGINDIIPLYKSEADSTVDENIYIQDNELKLNSDEENPVETHGVDNETCEETSEKKEDDEEGHAPSKEMPEEPAESGPEENDSVISEESEEFEEENSHSRNWIKILSISLGAAVVALFATLAIWYSFATDDFNGFFKKYGITISHGDKTAKLADKDGEATITHSLEPITAIDTLADSLQENESDEEVPTAPSDAVVYDTISTTRYLTTMAKDHYGNYNLWPYIYQENQSFLGHPDRIRPGTPVVIPKLSKYGVDPKNTDDIEKAKKLGVEIYARYGKKI